MTTPLPLSSRIYQCLLALYPADLRRYYGAEMALVFTDDLDAARREHGLSGVVRVWRQTVGEFLRLALPGCLSNSGMRVPAITCLVTFASLLAGATPRVAPIPLQLLSLALLPTSTLPIVVLLCLWACRGPSVDSLHLAPTPRPRAHPG
jgi:hypothetical protein